MWGRVGGVGSIGVVGSVGILDFLGILDYLDYLDFPDYLDFQVVLGAQWKFSGDKHKFLQVCTERIFHQLYPLVML